MSELLPAERYEILELLSEGGTGVIYRAKDWTKNEVVALKKIRPEYLCDPAAINRLHSEIRTLATLRHPHILPIYDVGLLDGTLFYTMPIAEGSSLANRLRDNWKTTAQLVIKIASALQFAHQRGILHGDLKPTNILLGSRRIPFVTDFGLAKSIAELNPGLALDDAPRYAAPEKCSGQPVTIASDIYSLGAVLYELLSGQPPFGEVNGAELLHLKKHSTPTPLDELDRAIPADIELICLHCLAIDPAERYSTAADLAADLENFLARRPLHIRPASAYEVCRAWMRRNPLIAALWGLFAFFIFAALIGSSIAIYRISQEKNRALTAEADARGQLSSASLAHARAARRNSLAGHRFEALDAIRNAAAIRITPELRSEAAVSLASADFRIVKKWSIRPADETFPILFSPDLKLTFRAAANGNFEVLDTASQQLLGQIRGKKNDPIISIAPLMSYGHLMATRCASGAIRVWDSAAPGAILLDLPGEPQPGNKPWQGLNFALNPAGLLAIGQADGRIALRETVLSAEVRYISSGTAISQLAFDPMGRSLAIVRQNSNAVEILDPEKPEIAPIILQHSTPIICLVWSADSSQFAAASADGRISVWRLSDQRCLSQLTTAHDSYPTQLLFSHSNTHLVSTATDSSIRLWNILAGVEESRLVGYGVEPALRFSPDDRHLYATDYSSTAIDLEVTLPSLCQSVAPLLAQDDTGWSGVLDFSENNQLLAIATNSSVQIRDAQTGTLLTALTDPADAPSAYSLAFAPFGESLYLQRRATGLARHSIQRKGEATIFGPNENQLKITDHDLTRFAPDGILLGLIDRQKNTAQIFNTTNFKVRPAAQFGGVWDLSIKPDGAQFLTSGSTQKNDVSNVGPTVFNLESGEKIHEFPLGPNGMGAWSSDGQWIAASGTQGCRLWSANDWTPGPKLSPDATATGTYLAWSPDGKLLAIAVSQRVEIYSAKDFTYLLALEAPLLPAHAPRLKFSRDSRHLALLSAKGSLQLWHLAALREALQAENLAWP